MTEMEISAPPVQTESSSIHWFNIPGLSSKATTLSNDFLLALQELTGLSKDSPLVIHMANGPMTDLDPIEHADDEIIFLNEVGLHIFFYEPICSYIEGTSFPRNGFYSEMHSDIDYTTLRSTELESIRKYCVRNKLTNITVHTCDYDIDRYYPHYTSLMTLIYDDLFLKSQVIYEVNNSPPESFSKKFICSNWRYTKPRNIIVAYLTSFPAHISWCFNVTPDALQENLWFELDSSIIDRVIYLSSISPVNLDMVRDTARVIVNDESYLYPEDNYFSPFNLQTDSMEPFYRDSFVSVVTESRFAQPTANYSEKLYQAIVHRRPFIMVAPPNSMRCVREAGFRTFSEFWDESYDTCANHEDRLRKIFELIDHLDSFSMDELMDKYIAMREVLEHNFNMLVSKSPGQTIRTRK